MKNKNNLLIFVFFALIYILISSGCAKNSIKEAKELSPPDSLSLVKGKIVYLGGSSILKDAYVYVYKDSQTDFKKSPFLISNPTDDNGEYSIKLPQGRYYFIARKFNKNTLDDSFSIMQPGDFYCYYGGNPVAIYQNQVTVNLNCSKIAKNESFEKSPDKESGVRGIVSYDDKPLSGAYVFAFKTSENDFRGPVFIMSEPTDKEGLFNLNLPPGEYYILAKKKKDTNLLRFLNVFQEGKEPTGNVVAGPLSPGDFFYYYFNNPITVIENNYVDIVLPAITKIGHEDIFQATYVTPTRIEGTVKFTDGKPAAGMRVFVFRRKIMGGDTPSFASNVTKEDGEYVIYLTEGGIFYLAARDFVGRAPKAGDIFGYYFGTEDYSVELKKDTVLKDIDITVWKVE